MPVTTLLAQADYPAVRALLDISLDSRGLPDTIIGLPPFAPRAEAVVLARVPDALDRTGEDARHLKLAALALCAAYLAPRIPNITSEQAGPTINLSRQAVDWKQRESDLFAEYDAELGQVSDVGLPTPPNQATRFKLFTLASGRRGY